MSHTTVRVRASTHARIRALAEGADQSMQSVIEQAIELLERRRFLESVNAAYGTLRQDAASWSAIREERAAWDSALGDGLGDATRGDDAEDEAERDA